MGQARVLMQKILLVEAELGSQTHDCTYTLTSVYTDLSVHGPRSYTVFFLGNSIDHNSTLGLHGYLAVTRFSTTQFFYKFITKP